MNSLYSNYVRLDSCERVVMRKRSEITHSIGRGCADTCHDGHDDMFFDCERSWVERDAEYFDARTYSGQYAPDRER